MHLRSACRVAAAQSVHDSFARVIGQRQGLLSQMGMDGGFNRKGVPLIVEGGSWALDYESWLDRFILGEF